MSKLKSNGTGLLGWSLGSLLLAFLAFFSREVVFIDPIFVSFAPDFLLLGLALNFMAHGNFVNSLLGRVLAGQISNPIKDFISRNFEVAEHLGQMGGPSQVMLETLAEKTFEPALLIKGENRESAKDPWPEKGWDAERYKFCDNLLRRESQNSHGGLVQVWWIFIQDTTERIKIRRTGNELCDEQSVWSFDYESQRESVTITKYSANGELQYRAIVQRPPAIYGYQGGIRQKTFHEADGYVYFEWRDENRPGFDLEIKRNLSLRFAAPKRNL
jgi:hypothetical protein